MKRSSQSSVQPLNETTNKARKILLVDDDLSLLKLLPIRLKALGFKVETASNGHQALGILKAFRPNLVITDLRMDGMDGIELFHEIHKTHPLLPVIILTAHGTIPDAVSATRKGVYSYLTKPFESQQLIDNISSALRQEFHVHKHKNIPPDEKWRQDIISCSQAMEQVLQQSSRVAQSDASILIQSASGTGKEMLARAIHNAGPRKNNNFIAINCAALPEALLESELFGHRKGAFTGADRNHIGLLEAATKGTLFLDEIGDMPLGFQAKLLRVLQEKEVRPLGATDSVEIDVRIISATHVDLEAAIVAGKFREDLYYRLNVVMLELPSLAERREDIPMLVNHFLTDLRNKYTNLSAKSFSPEAMETLLTASWPGNIRQLMNIIEQVAILSCVPIISAASVKKALRGKTDDVLPLAEAQSRFERDYLINALQMCHGNVTLAARLARRNRTEFYKLLNKHQLQPGLFRHMT